MARAEEADVTHFDRGTFLHGVWDYKVGEHVTILAPTGGGKTYLGYQLLAVTARPELPGVVMVMKPKDDTVTAFSRRNHFRTVRNWPPPKVSSVLHGKPRGWTLWPPFSYDPHIDEARHKVIFRRALLDCYRTGNRVIFADETYSLEEELGLTTELRTLWTKGRSAECGLWAASQRPAYISKWAYQAHHLFLAKDNDAEAQRRLAEIGAAVNPAHVRWAVERLREHEFLYINRSERAMCVVQAR